MMRRGIYWVRW